MKKLVFLFAAAVAIAFASCGNKAAQNEGADQVDEVVIVEEAVPVEDVVIEDVVTEGEAVAEEVVEEVIAE